MNNTGLITREGTILAIIDVQEKLLPAIYEAEKVLKNTIILARFARIIKMPVLVTEQEKLGATMPALKQELADIIPDTKIEFDAAGCTGFAARLAQLKPRNLVIAGIESHICISQTVLHLLPDYTVHVIADAVSSRTAENRRIALARMRQAGAIISSTEMVIYELLQRAGTEEFKAVLSLVK